jgi:hypothetical protein
MSLGYCIKCKEKVEVTDGKLIYYKNGTPVESGKCSKCGCKLNRMLSKEEKMAIQAQNREINDENSQA